MPQALRSFRACGYGRKRGLFSGESRALFGGLLDKFIAEGSDGESKEGAEAGSAIEGLVTSGRVSTVGALGQGLGLVYRAAQTKKPQKV